MTMSFAERMSPEDLSERIKIIAKDEADSFGLIAPAALMRIATIPREYSSRTTIEVDISQLRSAIQEIVQLAARDAYPYKEIGLGNVQHALEITPCHYLWFC
jgi:hypothetical protein